MLFSCSVTSHSLQPPWTATHQTSPSFTIYWSLLKLMSAESVMPSNHLILRHPILPPSVLPSIGVFSGESALHIKWPKYWSFSISHFNEYSGLISFRISWLDLLAVQGTLESLLQHHSSFQYLLLSDFKPKCQSTPVLLPGKSHGQRSLAGSSPWGHKESDMTEHIHMSSLPWIITNLLAEPSVSTPPVHSQHSSWNTPIKCQSGQHTSSSKCLQSLSTSLTGKSQRPISSPPHSQHLLCLSGFSVLV